MANIRRTIKRATSEVKRGVTSQSAKNKRAIKSGGDRLLKTGGSFLRDITNPLGQIRTIKSSVKQLPKAKKLQKKREFNKVRRTKNV